MRFRRKNVDLGQPERVSESITRLEKLADHLEDTAVALESLVKSMKEEDEEVERALREPTP